MNYVFQNCNTSLYLKSMIGPKLASALCVLTFCIQGSFSTGVETDRHAQLRPYPRAFGIKHLEKEEKESEGPYCPTASDILPCICIPNILEVPVLVTLECTNVNSKQLATVFQQDFPVQNMFELKISDSFEPLTLNFSTNGISFESIDIYNIGLLDIQEEFFAASFDRLRTLSKMQNPRSKNFLFLLCQDFKFCTRSTSSLLGGPCCPPSPPHHWLLLPLNLMISNQLYQVRIHIHIFHRACLCFTKATHRGQIISKQITFGRLYINENYKHFCFKLINY